MPPKCNPTGCQIARSAAVRAPGLVAAVLTALPAELERGLGGWQAKGPVLAGPFLLAGEAAAEMATVAGGLEIDPGALGRNLAASRLGTDVGKGAAIIYALLER